MSIWNLRDLNPPPHLPHTARKTDINVLELRRICFESASVADKLKLLRVEGATLSRLLYRHKLRLRSDKGIKYLSKINRNVLRFIEFHLEDLFVRCTPNIPDFGETEVYVPSRQMLEWVLVRTQGLAQLTCDTIQCCERAAVYLKMRVKLGHLWTVAMIFFAVVSRIWAIMKYIFISACEWYKKLLPYLEILKPNKVQWLPDDYELPSDLVTWMDAEWVLTNRKAERKPAMKKSLFDLIMPEEVNYDDDDEDDFKSVIGSITVTERPEPGLEHSMQVGAACDISEKESRVLQNQAKQQMSYAAYSLIRHEDVGESLSQEEMMSHFNRQSNQTSRMSTVKGNVKDDSIMQVDSKPLSIKQKSKARKHSDQRLIDQLTQQARHNMTNIESGIQNVEVNVSRVKNKKGKKSKSKSMVTRQRSQAVRIYHSDEKMEGEYEIKEKSTSFEHQIQAIQSSTDIRRFVSREIDLKSNGLEHITQNLNRLKSHKLNERLLEYAKQFDQCRGTSKKMKVIKQVKKTIKLITM